MFSHGKKLKNEIIYSYLNQFIVFLGGIFFLIFIPKLYGVVNFGIFSLILTYISLFSIFFLNSVQEGVKKEIVEEKNINFENINIFISNSFYLKIFGLIVFIPIVYIISNIFNIKVIIDNFWYYYFLCVGMSIQGLVMSIFNSLHDNKNIFLISIYEYIIKVLFILLFYNLFDIKNINHILLSFILGYFISSIIGVFILFFKLEIKVTKFNFRISKILLIRYFWLSLSSISFLLLTNIDNVMISDFFTNKELGYYNIATNIVNKSSIFTIAIVMSILPLFHKKQDKEIIKSTFYKYLKWIIGLNILLSAGILIFSDFGINLIYGKGFSSSIKIMEILSLFPLFAVLQVFFSGILTNFGNYKAIMIISFGIAILHIILNFILVNIMGLIGISIATILSYFIRVLILGWYIQYRIINN